MRFQHWRAIRAEIQRHQRYKGLSPEDIFQTIYKEKGWGTKGDQPFFSGTGSHVSPIIQPYVEAVKEVLRSYSVRPPVVLDIGAGDFAVGQLLVDCVSHYQACDIVPELQAYNSAKYKISNVSFTTLNAISDKLPPADIVIVRQVFQHLSNHQIQSILVKLYEYDCWIITEHVPRGKQYTPNIDIHAGCGVRLLFGSGVDLQRSPFNIQGYSVKSLVEVNDSLGVIRTLLFQRCK